VQSDQRGFSVAPVNEDRLDDLLRTRCSLNELALREAIKLGDAAWEEQVLLCAHRLQRIPRHSDTIEPRRNPDWEQAHVDFHRSILAACRSDILTTFCDQLFTEAERYRNMARSVGEQRSSAAHDEHQEIAEATIKRRADDAVRLLNAHYTRTASLVRRFLQS
jgi:GntR family carbon starvation induced transcriptional regulator